MKYSPIEKLKNPTKRKVIVVLKSKNYELLRMRDDNAWLQKDNILTIDLSNDNLYNNELYKKLSNGGLLEDGNVLFQDPYRWDDYIVSNTINADNFIVNNAIRKYTLLSQVCGLLGAKSVECTEVKLKNKHGNYTANANYGEKGINVGVSGEQDFVNKISNSIQFSDTYEEDNKLKPEQAKQFMEDNHLSQDSCISNLVDSIANYKLPLKEREITINCTQETTEILNISTNITLPTWSLGADFKKKLDTKEEINVRVKIKF